MINSLEYKLHPEAFQLIKKATKRAVENLVRETKFNLLPDMIFISLFLYARRVGTDKEHIDYLTKVTDMDTLELVELLGAIDKYQRELGQK